MEMGGRGSEYQLVKTQHFLERSGDTITQEKEARQGHNLMPEVSEESINTLEAWRRGGRVLGWRKHPGGSWWARKGRPRGMGCGCILKTHKNLTRLVTELACIKNDVMV